MRSLLTDRALGYPHCRLRPHGLPLGKAGSFFLFDTLTVSPHGARDVAPAAGYSVTMHRNHRSAGRSLGILSLGFCALTQACSSPEVTAAPPRAGEALASTELATELATATQNQASGGDLCVRVCALQEHLNCENDPADCTAHCREMQEVPICKAEIQGFLRCVAALSSDGLNCGEDGQSEVKQGHCDSEQEAVATCIETAAE